MITIDALGKALSEPLFRNALRETKVSFTEEAYPQPWEVILNHELFPSMAKLKCCYFLPTDFQVKHNYPPVEFHGMKVIQDSSFPKNMVEIRDARGKSIAAIKNLAVL